MFHQVKVRETDRDALRFVWRESPDQNISDFQMPTHLSGKIDSPCCAKYFLKKSTIDNVDLNPAFVKTTENDFYMDDFLRSHSSNKYLTDITKSVVSNLKNADSRLTKFTSNNQDIIEQLPSSEIINQTSISQQNVEDSYRKILGILWNIQTDVLKLCSIDYAYPNTKRGILSLLCTLFDPLEIAVPVLLEPKITVKDLWCQNIDWDQNILKGLEIRIETWKSQLYLLDTITIPRFHDFQNSSEIELNIFTDASSLAYGTVA